MAVLIIALAECQVEAAVDTGDEVIVCGEVQEAGVCHLRGLAVNLSLACVGLVDVQRQTSGSILDLGLRVDEFVALAPCVTEPGVIDLIGQRLPALCTPPLA